MKTIARIVVAAGSLACCTAFAACPTPASKLAIPKGATASREQMLEVAQQFRSYDAEVKQYLACLDRTGALPSAGKDELRKLRELADRYNLELREFKAKADQ